jgi:hypothetical protein
MDHFEYEITTHHAEAFMQIVYFCSEEGDCKLEEIPAEEPQMFTDLLNSRGQDGWELVQLNFRKNGVLAFWKRKLTNP